MLVDSKVHTRKPKDLTEKDLLRPCGMLFLYAVIRFLFGSRTKDNISLVGDVWVVNTVKLEGI